MNDYEYDEFSFPEQEPPGKNSRSLLFSIFLVMLAFFILLNSISLIDTKKTHDSMSSIKNKFSDAEGMSPIMITGPDTKMEGAPPLGYFGEMEKIARESVELIHGSVVTNAGRMEVQMPLDAFFVKDSSAIQDFQQTFLKRLADQMIRYQKMDIEFSIASAGQPPYTADNLAVARGAAFARAMQDLGIDESQIYTGIREGDDDENLKIIFFIRNGEKKS